MLDSPLLVAASAARSSADALPWWTYVMPVVGALVGGTIGLSGALIGPWLKSRSDLDQWRLQQRLDAYRDLATAANLYLHTISNHVRLGQEDAANAQSREDVTRDLREFDKAATFAQLIAPRDVQRAVLLMYEAGTGEILQSALTLAGENVPDFDEQSRRFLQHYDQFMQAAAASIGFEGYVAVPDNLSAAKEVKKEGGTSAGTR